LRIVGALLKILAPGRQPFELAHNFGPVREQGLLADREVFRPGLHAGGADCGAHIREMEQQPGSLDAGEAGEFLGRGRARELAYARADRGENVVSGQEALTFSARDEEGNA